MKKSKQTLKFETFEPFFVCICFLPRLKPRKSPCRSRRQATSPALSIGMTTGIKEENKEWRLNFEAKGDEIEEATKVSSF